MTAAQAVHAMNTAAYIARKYTRAGSTDGAYVEGRALEAYLQHWRSFDEEKTTAPRHVYASCKAQLAAIDAARHVRGRRETHPRRNVEFIGYDEECDPSPQMAAAMRSCSRTDVRAELREVMGRLTTREKQIVRRLYRGELQAEVAERQGVTQARISQLVSRMRRRIAA